MLRLGLIVGACLLAVTGWAYPTLTGPTGLVSLPTGELPVAGIQLAADQHDIEDGYTRPLRANLVFGHGLEVGASYSAFSDVATLDESWGLHAKLVPAVIETGHVAIGAQYLKVQSAVETDFWQGYLAWTSDFNPEYFDDSNLHVTLGATWTQMEDDNGVSVDAVRPFIGVQIDLSRNLDIIAEWQMKDEELGDRQAIASLAARLDFGNDLAVQAGVTNAVGFLGADDRSFFVGISLGLTPSSGP